MIEKLMLCYLMSGMRWAFYGGGGLDVTIGCVTVCGLLVVCVAAIGSLFKTDYERHEPTQCARFHMAGEFDALHKLSK